MHGLAKFKYKLSFSYTTGETSTKRLKNKHEPLRKPFYFILYELCLYKILIYFISSIDIFYIHYWYILFYMNYVYIQYWYIWYPILIYFILYELCLYPILTYFISNIDIFCIQYWYILFYMGYVYIQYWYICVCSWLTCSVISNCWLVAGTCACGKMRFSHVSIFSHLKLFRHFIGPCHELWTSLWFANVFFSVQS